MADSPETSPDRQEQPPQRAGQLHAALVLQPMHQLSQTARIAPYGTRLVKDRPLFQAAAALMINAHTVKRDPAYRALRRTNGNKFGPARKAYPWPHHAVKRPLYPACPVRPLFIGILQPGARIKQLSARSATGRIESVHDPRHQSALFTWAGSAESILQNYSIKTIHWRHLAGYIYRIMKYLADMITKQLTC